MRTEGLVELVEDGRAWVVAVEDEVVGFLGVRVVEGAAHVEEVSVDPRFGRHGHGTRLLDQAAAWAAEQGLAAVTLTTFRDVPWNQPFYARRGYRVLAADELGPALRDLMLEEEDLYQLPRELRVVMRRDVR
jgi:ribosomal protein S18 acetylase RimI-like enzyme